MICFLRLIYYVINTANSVHVKLLMLSVSELWNRSNVFLYKIGMFNQLVDLGMRDDKDTSGFHELPVCCWLQGLLSSHTWRGLSMEDPPSVTETKVDHRWNLKGCTCCICGARKEVQEIQVQLYNKATWSCCFQSLSLSVSLLKKWAPVEQTVHTILTFQFKWENVQGQT